MNRVRRAAPWFILGTFLLIASCCASAVTGFNRGAGVSLPPVNAPGGVWTWGNPDDGGDNGSWNDRGDWGGSDSGSWGGGDWDSGGDDSGSCDWGSGDDSDSWDWGSSDDGGSWDWGGSDSGSWDSGGSDSGSW